MQSDKELLMLAAKAFGLKGAYMERVTGAVGINRGPMCALWNSLSDRGDALILMARLNINVYYRENINGAFVIADHEGIEFCPESLDGPDEVDATCRAITRAAAQLAQAQEGK